MYVIKRMDHAHYQKQLRTKEVAELRYIMQDAREALAAYPDGPNAGYYQDEIHYVAAELRRRTEILRRGDPNHVCLPYTMCCIPASVSIVSR